MILTSSMLKRELGMIDGRAQLNDNFITVILNNEEYLIENIVHVKTHGDRDCTSHLALKVKPVEEGCLYR